MDQSKRQVRDKIIEKTQQEIATLPADEALKQLEALKTRLGKAGLPVPREIVQMIAQKRDEQKKQM